MSSLLSWLRGNHDCANWKVSLPLGRSNPVAGGPQYSVSKWHLVCIKRSFSMGGFSPVPRSSGWISVPLAWHPCAVHILRNINDRPAFSPPYNSGRISCIPISRFIDLFRFPNRQSTAEGTKTLIYLCISGEWVPINCSRREVCWANNDQSTNTCWNEFEIGVLAQRLPIWPKR